MSPLFTLVLPIACLCLAGVLIAFLGYIEDRHGE